MATTVDRAMAKAEAALLPGLLPTPPTSPTIIILPADFPKPGRADSVKRWDTHKNGKAELCSPALASSQPSNTSSSSSSKSPGRADAVDRWDAHKKKKLCAVSPGRANSSEPWRMSKKSPSSSGSPPSPPCDKWVSNKRPASRPSSTDRWDAHKKHRWTAEAADAESQDGETGTKMKAVAGMTDYQFFSGAGFITSPDPSVLPIPAAFFPGAMRPAPSFLVAH